LGYIVRGPLGGLVWHHFQYVYGLYLMGHDVLFVEESDDYPSCYNPETYEMTMDPGYGLNFISAMFSHFNLGDKWAYYDFRVNRWYGRTAQQAKKFLKEADILLNISGVNLLTDRVLHIPEKILIDTDPVFTQVRHLNDGMARQNASGHNTFFTFGENYNKQGCTIPQDGFPWQPTRQPVILDLWENDHFIPDGRWSTVMQWDSYKTAHWNTHSYGMKSLSFQLYYDLPALVGEKFELALGSVSAPREDLCKKGWLINDPLQVTLTPFSYRHFIWQSKGEWSVAKQGYVTTRSGWFSERSAVYLASGKPVVVEDTGFAENIETGNGLFGFRNIHELDEIFSEIENNYTFHCQKAREICHQYFNYESVLGSLLDRI
jgi:hypothetical protein